MFGFLANALDGVAGAAVNTAKAVVGVVAIPFDDGATLDESVRGIKKSLKKIGQDK